MTDRVWRLLIDDACDGADNMALDRAIQLLHAAGEVPPTLRLYSWRRPTVTLGRFQASDGVDLAACDRYGVDVVRRWTGGRGVLHDDEITYSVVAGTSDGVPRGVAASYRYLCHGVAEAYRDLGVEAELTAGPRGDSRSSACYLQTTRADLSVGTAKLSGSAQVWHRDTVLQHGSFVRSRDIQREAAVFCLEGAASDRLERRTVTLEGLLGERPDDERLKEAAAAGMQRGLGIRCELGTVLDAEREEAQRLRTEALVRQDDGRLRG